MPKFSQKYAIASFPDILPDGYEFPASKWPLHVTLADVFAVNTGPDVLLGNLQSLHKTQHSLASRVTSDEFFGEDGSIHVRVLEKTGDLQLLHRTVVDILESYGVEFNSPQYTRDGFKPHVTVSSDASPEIGDNVTLGSLSIVDMYPNNDAYQRRVIGTVKFL